MTQINQIQKEIPDTSRLVRKTYYNANITEIESKKPSITASATSSALTAVENEISNVSNLVKKTDFDAKLLYIESKYITTTNYNKFTSKRLDAKIKQKELVSKSEISHFGKNVDLNLKNSYISNKSK